MDGTSVPPIEVGPCIGRPVTPPKPFGRYGLRGWRDEDCEWSVRRDGKGSITRVDFTRENPECWNTLRKTDPQRVLDLDLTTLGKPQIQLDGLSLKGRSGVAMIGPSTGRPGDDGLNRPGAVPIQLTRATALDSSRSDEAARRDGS